MSGLIRRISWPLFVVGGFALGNALGQTLAHLPAFAHFGSVAMLCPLGGALIGSVMGRAGSRTATASTVHGSASFATERQIQASLGGGEGLIVGRENRRNGRLLRYCGPAHLLTIAPTRSGKGVGAIIPNLLTANRSILCIDPKGENARVAASARHRLGPVYVLDPFGVSGIPTAAFNPLDALNPESLDLAEDAALVADALVYDPPGQVGDAHWNEEAKALIGGLILHVVTGNQPEIVHLPMRATGYMTQKGHIVSAADTLPWSGTPAGGGYSTVGDLAKFTDALMANRLLDATHTKPLTDGGFTAADGKFWRYDFGARSGDGRRFYGHSGVAPGMSGELRIFPASAGQPAVTIVVLANRDPPVATGAANFISDRLP